MKGYARTPAYDLRPAKREDVVALFEKYHGYRSLSKALTYCFAVYEDEEPVAAYAWQPPPPGAAKAVCPEAPQGTLSLSLAWSRASASSADSNTLASRCGDR